ncbi:MAG: TIGR04423 family type III CRISPR-associated protein [Bacteroidaceae bacterium]|nr:TIGR04423 family type III CRISPR-associated protein [Bacteroidaceae bacterium]
MKIVKSKYQGYLWYSNATKPQVIYNEEFELDIPGTQNPFIVEGQLCDGEKSISIKFVDGKYLVKTYTLADYSNITAEEYIPNRMDNVEKLLFKRAWKQEKDELCEGWNVLHPAEFVFVGLKMKEDKK